MNIVHRFQRSGNKIKKWTTFLWSELKHLFTYSPIHLFYVLEIKCKMENLLWSELKQLFTYSPIHLFTFLATPLDKQFRNSVLVNSTVHHRQSSGKKWNMDNLPLVGVKTPLYLFTYSLSGNKMKNGKCSIGRSSNNYSPIHLFTICKHP
jgi:hypothetical protein